MREIDSISLQHGDGALQLCIHGEKPQGDAFVRLSRDGALLVAFKLIVEAVGMHLPLDEHQELRRKLRQYI